MDESYLQQEGYISILTIPSRAKIFIDGNEWPEPTPEIIPVSLGYHTYRLTYPRYIDVEGLIYVEEPRTYELFITMQKSSIIKDIIIYGFIASFAAGLTLYTLTKRQSRTFG